MVKRKKIITKEEFRKKPEKKVKIPVGGIWEYKDWYIVFDCPVNLAYEYPCHHCRKKFFVRTYAANGKYYDEEYTICPRVVVAENEGGFNTTGVCLDCILEAVDKLEELTQEED